MPDYNFLNLSPPEFEDLSKDLLQKELSIVFEAFTNGRDNGIDLRHTFAKNNIIVQCKRYQEYTSFISVLKKEKAKIQAISPDRYIITTSVGLTPNQKDEILKLFDPYISSTKDIYGKDDLNNLLGIHSEVERKHFKLWLSSTNILQKILHSKVYNQSTFEKEKIQETVRVYVENDSYYEALNILKKNKYVIISGLPGIGKTTLARILVYHFLANGFDEFIFLSDSINEGYEFYKDNVKQIFLFDDFLGRNFLDRNLSNNEEQRIIRFIEKVNSSDDKILLLTTREYILRQAQQKYDVFDNPLLEFAKCVIDLSHYTILVRAKILYNHIFFSNITNDYIKDFLGHKAYEAIINHRNYNPRIIQTILTDNIWKNIIPTDFSNQIVKFLDYPESVWKHVYENQISRFSQCLLINILIAGPPLLLEDLKILINSFANKYAIKYGFMYSEFEVMKSIRELENTFISSKKDEINQIAIDYQNPSIQDFLVNYIKDSEDFIENIVDTAIFFNQLFHLFSTKEYVTISGKKHFKVNNIILKGKLLKKMLEKILTDYENLSSSIIYPVYYNNNPTSNWSRKKYSDYNKLNKIISEFSIGEYPHIYNFAIDKFSQLLLSGCLIEEDLSDYINLLNVFKGHYIYDKKIIVRAAESLNSLMYLNDFTKLETLFPEDYNWFVNSIAFKDMLLELINSEAEYTPENNLESTLEDIERINDKFNVDCDEAIQTIENRMRKIDALEDSSFDWDKEIVPERTSSGSDDKQAIREMFEGLKFLDDE